MKDENIVNAFNTIQPDAEAKNRVWEKVCRKQQKKRSGRKLVISFVAIAATLCLAFYGGSLLTDRDGGEIFTVKAYAMTTAEDGAIQLSEADMVNDRPQYWGGYVDCETNTMYVGLDVRCDSEDVASVELSTDGGFFARQYIGDTANAQKAGQTVELDHIGSPSAGYKLFLSGGEFDVMGEQIAFDRESLDDYLFFWAMTYEDGPDGFDEDPANFYPPFPQELRLEARVTTNDGKTVEQQVAIDLSGKRSISSKSSDEQMAQDERKQAAFNKLAASISPDDCPVAPDGVKQLSYGDSYEYLTTGDNATAILYITEESMSRLPGFSETGLFRLSTYLPGDGSDGHIVNLVRNDDGTFSGVTYIVPGELIMLHYEEEATTGVAYIQPRQLADDDPRLPDMP